MANVLLVIWDAKFDGDTPFSHLNHGFGQLFGLLDLFRPRLDLTLQSQVKKIEF